MNTVASRRINPHLVEVRDGTFQYVTPAVRDEGQRGENRTVPPAPEPEPAPPADPPTTTRSYAGLRSRLAPQGHERRLETASPSVRSGSRPPRAARRTHLHPPEAPPRLTRIAQLATEAP